MAIALDALLGSSTTSSTVTTGSAAASGSRVYLIVTSFSTTFSLSSVSGGGLSWVVDRNGASDQNTNLAIASADAPAGMANTTTITPTVVGSAVPMACAFSFTGIAGGTSGYLSGTPPTPVTTFGGTTAWTAPGILTADADALVIAGSVHDGVTPFSSVPGGTTPYVELYDIHSAANTQTLVVGYNIVSSIGTYALTGVWSAVPSEYRKLTAAYKSGVLNPVVQDTLHKPMHRYRSYR